MLDLVGITPVEGQQHCRRRQGSTAGEQGDELLDGQDRVSQIGKRVHLCCEPLAVPDPVIAEDQGVGSPERSRQFSEGA